MVLIFGFFEIMATFFESYFCFRFNDLFVTQKMQKKKCVILSAILTIMMYSINSIQLFTPLALLMGLVFVSLCSHFIFKIPLFDTFSITAFFSFCLLFFDFFSMAIMGLFLDNNEFASNVVEVQSVYRCVFLCISKSLLFITYQAVRKLLEYLKKLKSRSLLFITILGYIGIGYYAKYTFEYIDLTLLINWFSLFIIIILILFSLLAYICYQREIEQKKIIEVRNAVITDNYDELTKSYSGNAQLYHDMKNHILVLQSLFENEKQDEAKKYLKSLFEATSALDHTWTGNDIIDCILNIKKTTCEQKNINITIDADPLDINLDGIMINTIMANLLDNAIEASQKMEDHTPYIRVAIRHINDMIFVKIQNQANDEITDLKNDFLCTTKNNKSNQHGWGLKSVEAAVKQVDGVFRYYFRNGEFVSVVTLFL